MRRTSSRELERYVRWWIEHSGLTERQLRSIAAGLWTSPERLAGPRPTSAGPTVFADVNPCTGVPGTLTDTFKGVNHVTALPNGSFHDTTTITDRLTFVPDDPSQPTYTGKATTWFGANLNSQNNFTATFTTHFTVKGTDGSRITGHEVAHVTVHADGTVTVEFEKARLTCP